MATRVNGTRRSRPTIWCSCADQLVGLTRCQATDVGANAERVRGQGSLIRAARLGLSRRIDEERRLDQLRRAGKDRGPDSLENRGDKFSLLDRHRLDQRLDAAIASENVVELPVLRTETLVSGEVRPRERLAALAALAAPEERCRPL